MVTKIIEDLEEEALYEDDYPELPPPDIVAYNELRSCADLLRMHTEGILKIQPEFQREIVWKDKEQTRFVDSLVKQLPIPSMCFSMDHKTQKWQVIDGLQRIWSIIRFLTDSGWALSKLEDIDPKISGQPVSKFAERSSGLHSYYTRVENLSLPITILRCDYSNKSHTKYLFTIFHRLNSGGSRLNNQEIRNCIYSGAFNHFLKELNKNPQWMTINKMKRTTGYRFNKEEIILRFFAFHDSYDKYGGRLAKFLNEYMEKHRNSAGSFLGKKGKLFNRTVKVIFESVFDSKAPKKLSTTVLEALMVGISLNIDFIESQSAARIKAMYEKLLTQEEFSEERLKEGLSGKDRVTGRMSTAKRVFSGQ